MSEQKPLTGAAARRLTDQIRMRLSDVLPLIAEAYRRRADAALGYDSWEHYCQAEFAGVAFPAGSRALREDAVVRLKDDRMSNRAIGQALGIDEKTVREDLKSRNYTQSRPAGDSAPRDSVRGLDRKLYPSSGPSPEARAKPAVIKVKQSPLYYAGMALAMVAEIDGEHYGPDDLTAEQLRVLGGVRDALAEFARIFDGR